MQGPRPAKSQLGRSDDSNEVRCALAGTFSKPHAQPCSSHDGRGCGCAAARGGWTGRPGRRAGMVARGGEAQVQRRSSTHAGRRSRLPRGTCAGQRPPCVCPPGRRLRRRCLRQTSLRQTRCCRGPLPRPWPAAPGVPWTPQLWRRGRTCHRGGSVPRRPFFFRKAAELWHDAWQWRERGWRHGRACARRRRREQRRRAPSSELSRGGRRPS